MICNECEWDFPEDMISELEIGELGPAGQVVHTKRKMCVLCAYSMINEAHGLPPGTPPPESAPKARALYFRARKHLEEASKKALLHARRN